MTKDSRDALIALLIESRDMDYPASLYKFTPERMADAILDSEWFRAHLAATGGAERGLRAAVEALIPREDPELIEAGYAVLASDLLAALDAAPTAEETP